MEIVKNEIFCPQTIEILVHVWCWNYTQQIDR